MSRPFDIGVMFRCQNPPEQLVSYVKRAEQAGFDEVWIVEDCFFAGGISSAATALAVTEKIRIGLGIMPAVVRNPAFVAMEIATLARLYPGRFLSGLGHGVGEWMKQIGAFPPSQLTALEETTLVVRDLLAGKTVNFTGEYAHLSDVQLEFPPASVPPVSLGVRGPKSLHLSGRVADGTILAEHASAAYVHRAREQIATGQKANGRENAAHRITVYTFCRVDTDRDRAFETMRPILARGLASGQLSVYLEPLGIASDVKRLVDQGGASALEEHMPDAWIAQLAVVGTPSDCKTAILNLVEAGADSVVLVPVGDDSAVLDEITQTLLPQLQT